jgi:hypothetical protein
MDPRTLHQRREKFQVLDVREDDEWAAGGIAGARHIPPSGSCRRVSTSSTATGRSSWSA